MKIRSPNGNMTDIRKLKRLMRHYLRYWRRDDAPFDQWAGRRPPNVTWRKAISGYARQRNTQHRMDKITASMKAKR